MIDIVGKQYVPRIMLYLNGVYWGSRNWVSIPRVGDEITAMYRFNKFDVPKPLPCKIVKIIWDEIEKDIGEPVEQLITIFAEWPDNVDLPNI